MNDPSNRFDDEFAVDPADDIRNDTAQDASRKTPEAGSPVPASGSAAPKPSFKETAKTVFGKGRTAFAALGFDTSFFMRIFASYFLVMGAYILFFLQVSQNKKLISDWKNYVVTANAALMILSIAAVFLLLTAGFFFLRKKQTRLLDPAALAAGLMLYCFSILWCNDNFYLCIVMILLCTAFFAYLLSKIKAPPIRNEKPLNIIIFVILLVVAALVTAFVAITQVAHNNIFGTSTFDFGIFTQMYHSLVNDLSAVTTCERDQFLSHFNVHASYIYYLLVPLYALFPTGNTLLIVQPILAMLGLIPLYLIAKNHGMKRIPLIGICLVYIFSIMILAPCYYDFHENAFLPPLLLWLIYALEKRRPVLMFIMGALTLIVKEDAALYVLCICFFFLAQGRKKDNLGGKLSNRAITICTLILTAASLIYFAFITWWMGKYGDGQMMASIRFGSLTINENDGFLGIIYNVLVNPTHFFSMLLSEKTLLFLIQVFLPLLFLPFMTRKLHRYWLMIPFIIMNLTVGAGYGYASSIGYQYTFGPGVLLIYMSLLNAADLPHDFKKGILACAGVASVLMCICTISGNISYVNIYQSNAGHYQTMEQTLASIPEDAVVVSNTWFQPHIANRKEVYLLDGADLNWTTENGEKVATGLINPERYDCFVMSHADELTDKYYIPFLQKLGFVPFKDDGTVVIYVSPQYAASLKSRPVTN